MLDLISDDKTARYVQQSITEQLETVSKRLDDDYDQSWCADHGAPRKNSMNNEASKKWDDNTDLTKAGDLALTGWSKGQRRLKDLAAELPSYKETARQRAPKYRTQGGTPVVGRYLTGKPTYFRRRERIEKKAIDISLPVAAPANFSATQFKNRGLALVALVEKYEALGYAVTLTVNQASRFNASGKDHFLMIETPLKTAGQVIDRDLIMFVTAHPAFFRRIGFAGIEYFAPDSTWQGYGRSITDSKTVSDNFAFIPQPANKIYITAGTHEGHHFGSLKKAFDYLDNHIAEMLSKSKRAA